MKNEKGFGVILIAFLVFILIVSFMGSASVYFSSLYTAINRQQQVVAGYLVMQDFAAMAQNAREVALRVPMNGPCPGGTQPEPGPTGGFQNLCWPPVGSATGAHCVPHPLGNTNPNNPRLICRTISGTPEAGRSAMDITLQVVEPPRSWPDWIQEKFYALRWDFNTGLDILALKIQNVALAQGSDTQHLPSIAGAPSTNFVTPINCGVYAAALSPYCKRCQGLGSANLSQCFRMRVCLNPTGCNAANNNEWVVQTIGLLNR